MGAARKPQDDPDSRQLHPLPRIVRESVPNGIESLREQLARMARELESIRQQRDAALREIEATRQQLARIRSGLDKGRLRAREAKERQRIETDLDLREFWRAWKAAGRSDDDILRAYATLKQVQRDTVRRRAVRLKLIPSA